MSDNYPPGAAKDPSAPYNQPVDTETNVFVTTKMVKAFGLLNVHRHVCTEYEIDPDTGRRVPYHFTEADDLAEAFDAQERHLDEVLLRCFRVCEQLIIDGHRFYANINIPNLMEECSDWGEESFDIDED